MCSISSLPNTSSFNYFTNLTCIQFQATHVCFHPLQSSTSISSYYVQVAIPTFFFFETLPFELGYFYILFEYLYVLCEIQNSKSSTYHFQTEMEPRKSYLPLNLMISSTLYVFYNVGLHFTNTQYVFRPVSKYFRINNKYWNRKLSGGSRMRCFLFFHWFSYMPVELKQKRLNKEL